MNKTYEGALTTTLFCPLLRLEISDTVAAACDGRNTDTSERTRKHTHTHTHTHTHARTSMRTHELIYALAIISQNQI